LFKSLIMGKVDGSYPNMEAHLLDAFEGYLKPKVSPRVRYEYMRIVKHFLKEMHGISMGISDPRFAEKLKEFLDIDNPYTYRNTLAALKHFFKLLDIADFLNDFKFKASMPNFSIATPSFEEILKFHDAISNDRVKFYFELGIVSAIRPEHLLRLTKKLFDRPNRMINTWQKTFGKKNFFFSFYTENLRPRVETHLDSLPKPDSLLFPLSTRYIQKEFVRASEKSGILITPKMMRKFATNWLRRHGMIPEDVDAITSHLAYSVVARHYLDNSRIKAEYDSAMKDIIFSFDLEDSKSFLMESITEKRETA
jgi:integrase